MGAARNRASLKRLGVHGIVNASPVVPCFHRSCFQYKTVTIYDDAEEDISQHFHTTNQFITEVWCKLAHFTERMQMQFSIQSIKYTFQP